MSERAVVQPSLGPYLFDVHAALPRLLALFDTNAISKTRGIGDRFRWSWKGIDFANGTYQGAAHGIARLAANSLLPEWLPKSSALARIDSIFEGTRAVMRPNGSLDEILPYESSFCVTALVAFDLLSAIDCIGNEIGDADRARYLAVVRPLVDFVGQNGETHGIISNHLAVAAAALGRWTKATGEDTNATVRRFLDVIDRNRSSEGWLTEYEGADPGYQTLAIEYLADLDRSFPELGLGKILSESVRFLSYCAHPDGSFGGLYGSRNTRFLYPGGIEELARALPDAAALARFARRAHEQRTAVGLAVMDDPNLVPMFNSFCRAAAAAAKHQTLPKSPLPHEWDKDFRVEFPEAGLVFDKYAGRYAAISWKKGGIVQSYEDGKSRIDPGIVARDHDGLYFTSQVLTSGHTMKWAGPDTMEIDAKTCRYDTRHPTPLDFLLLRVLNLTFARISFFNRLIKKAFVYLLITRKSWARAVNRRTIRLRPEQLIEDRWLSNPDGLARVDVNGPFQAIHMASQGYWQRKDDML